MQLDKLQKSKSIANTAKKAEEFARGMITGGTLFEELGFYYIGPIDVSII